ncbi:MAG: nuclear transport factor 2 family protein [Dissulfuribacterales bacterium]
MAPSMEQRIQIIEDIESIKKLKHLYCYLADAGIAGNLSKMDELMMHFTDDAWIDFGELGIHKGKEMISKFYKEFVATFLSYSAHMLSNPIIKVDGDKAEGSWYVFVPCTIRDTNTPVWLQAKYDETYVRVGDEWKWASMVTRFDFITPIDEGWVKTRMPSF